ncbi:hypothetical protein GTA62_07545 [Roseobacter sp. HKCCD9010]|uniref:hypothetical protein n=1 Tax=unclassified Roseobacter TaxID=196798 RepID=UPI00149116F6|nr:MULTISPECIES: hypothetical protein [unclassified Roseobacter]MBF9052232.1 hypothetical protein [Rhodobacterales bacterium HKCCD4356]NNV14071.1 hypothetical protein [Roseobacter sp. HKCCD7357]NNV18392.1 hypothetical protein [Roseobacter sp. HKCCD8768]NNV27831.1 hypothetical protein [Roseobacter sp. HKCCD8192]NNV32512.1 hypothetical protein [Roseobacter sp. HKCCD9061]
MKLSQILTWAIVGLSITVAQPALAQDRGESTRDESRESAREQQVEENRSRQDEDDSRSDAEQLGAVGQGAVPIRRVGRRNTTTSGDPISTEELELTCGAGGWLETWLEDGDGNPIPGTYEYYCLD